MIKIRRKKDTENKEDFQFYIENPTDEVFDDRRVTIKGWLVPKNGIQPKNFRIFDGNQYLSVTYGLNRPDVAKAFPNIEKDIAIKSGFISEVEFHDSPLILEVSFDGTKYEKLYTFNFVYSGDVPAHGNYNPYLATNWANHLDILQAKSDYYFEEPHPRRYVRNKNDPKLIAFYLPQFHPIPENDKAWSPGFTEWTNVVAAQPKFAGHYQPMLPRDLGFYDLRFEETIEKQIYLAKSQGLHGFCFYYYWFSGKEVLEKPLKSFLRRKDWDFNFMICWANENWTKRWDGADEEIIIKQKYHKEDPIKFIEKIEHILLDPRYIRKEGKPVLAVYRVADMKNPKRCANIWREYFRTKHNIELHLLSVLSFSDIDPTEQGFDGGIEFVPQAINLKKKAFDQDKPININVSNDLLDTNFKEPVSDLRQIILTRKFHEYSYDFLTYPCVMPSWDNVARRKNNGSVFHNSSPDLYARWLDEAINKDKEYTFINAWNEWGEGTTLEPTMHYGHALGNRTREVLSKRNKAQRINNDFPLYGISRSKNAKLAVVIHLYYVDQWEYIKDRLKAINGHRWDLYITMQKSNENFVHTIRKDYPKSKIIFVPNRGRDILPFLFISKRLMDHGYKSVLKLHTKKSKHRKDGDKWFKDLVDNLLPDNNYVTRAIDIVNKSKVMIGPKKHYLLLDSSIAKNETRIEQLLTKIYDKRTALNMLNAKSDYAYFAGSMFWTNLQTIKPLLDLYLMPEDFEMEMGKIDGTTAHAVERLIGIIGGIEGDATHTISKQGIKPIRIKNAIKKYKYAK